MKTISQKALSRLAVIGPLASRDRLNKGELKTLIHDIASKTHHLAGSKRVHVNEATIERWYYAWKEGGVDALEPKLRRDRGNSKLSAEIQAAILAAKKEDPSRSIRRIVQKLVSNKMVGHGELSKSGVYRFLLSNDLNSRTSIDAETIERRRFVAEKCGQIWQADVLHGPRILIEGKYLKTYLVSFMDDASRLMTHSEFRFGETEWDIQIVLKQALLKRGMPSRI
ncbi:MAG TPA: helix-turn-helix domain-containing protein, partial [Gammaproteobacteria bacterium]|nr:helix-turn-helix domain-containing protein [Gammaproteobacteria bacterium]